MTQKQQKTTKNVEKCCSGAEIGPNCTENRGFSASILPGSLMDYRSYQMQQPAHNAFRMATFAATPEVQEVVILLSEGAAMADCSAITQPLKSVNDIVGTQLFRWRFLTLNEGVQKLSCGSELASEAQNGPLHRDTLVFLNWDRPSEQESGRLAQWLRRQDRCGNKFVLLGSSVLTAIEAGILNDIPVAVHWEWIDFVRELYPEVRAVDQLYSVSPRVSASTCSDATIDLVIGFIEAQHGTSFARKVQERLNRPYRRLPNTSQSIPLSRKYGTRNPTFLAVVERIQNCFDENLSVEELCQEFDISRRQLERLFADRAGTSPLKFIKDYRLGKAQQLLQVTDMSVIEVAIACGFPTDACFRAAFKRKFGMTPSKFV
ncbi:helix-turn-helix domain-containing protein [Aliiroseovarius sp. KMU-50]|uniref:Helix-turn-helix domain-containing protein n=1 Tax=Aliiroseovarius salicola TaxID=3009082 RepID=A0ABT4W0W4_9RHOB|nr:helix-turn-helix domain-containing protein [Aliiroseovarius sp. KMU-50]MDA5094137.1 helix-turn-helix domain-containing protein [Aliiroseovarius sp. KMU-50]